jgi:hypothetical protein
MNKNNANLSIHNITEVIETKSIYDTFIAHDLVLYDKNGEVMKISIFSYNEEIEFRYGTEKDYRTRINKDDE